MFTNEKGCLSYNMSDMTNYDDLGLVALDSQSIGNRGLGKKRTKCGISSGKLNIVDKHFFPRANLHSAASRAIGFLLNMYPVGRWTDLEQIQVTAYEVYGEKRGALLGIRASGSATARQPAA